MLQPAASPRHLWAQKLGAADGDEESSPTARFAQPKVPPLDFRREQLRQLRRHRPEHPLPDPPPHPRQGLGRRLGLGPAPQLAGQIGEGTGLGRAVAAEVHLVVREESPPAVRELPAPARLAGVVGEGELQGCGHGYSR